MRAPAKLTVDVQDPTDADAICEWLDQRQIIQMEWRKVKDLMEAARGVEVHKGQDDD